MNGNGNGAAPAEAGAPRELKRGFVHEDALRSCLEKCARVYIPPDEAARKFLDEICKTDILLLEVPSGDVAVPGVHRGPVAIQVTLDSRQRQKALAFLIDSRAVADRQVYISFDDPDVVRPSRSWAELVVGIIRAWPFDATYRNWRALGIHFDRHYRMYVYDLEAAIEAEQKPVRETTGMTFKGKVIKVVADRDPGKQPYAHLECYLPGDPPRRPHVFFFYFDQAGEATRQKLLAGEIGFKVEFKNKGFDEEYFLPLPGAEAVTLAAPAASNEQVDAVDAPEAASADDVGTA